MSTPLTTSSFPSPEQPPPLSPASTTNNNDLSIPPSTSTPFASSPTLIPLPPPIPGIVQSSSSSSPPRTTQVPQGYALPPVELWVAVFLLITILIMGIIYWVYRRLQRTILFSTVNGGTNGGGGSGQNGKPGAKGDTGATGMSGCPFEINLTCDIVNDDWFTPNGNTGGTPWPWQDYCVLSACPLMFQNVLQDLRNNMGAPLPGDMSGHLISYNCQTGVWTDVASWIGPAGATGATGATGGMILDAADFFAIMSSVPMQPNDNPNPIVPGDPVLFPNPGSTYDLSGNIALDPTASPPNSAVLLVVPGLYFYTIVASVDESALLVLALQPGTGGPIIEQSDHVYGRNATNNQIVGSGLIRIQLSNTRLSVRNPSTNPQNVTMSLSNNGPDMLARLTLMQLSS